MFLSQLPWNLRDMNARRDLASSYELHRTLWNCFPNLRRDPDRGVFPERILFRVDTDRRNGCPIVLVQSALEPAWDQLPPRRLLAPAECKPVDPQFTAGQRLRFRLRANPTKRIAAKNPHLGATMVGKRVGMATEVDQIEWLLRKGIAAGFTIPGQWVPATDPETEEPIRLPNFRVDAIPEGRDRNGKKGHGEGVFHAVRFEGVLIVTDPIQFRTAWSAGIGSAKGYGFGLLSIAAA